MPAAITDKFRKGAAAFSTTLASQKAQGAGTMSLSSATGVPTDTALDFTVGRVDSSGNPTPSVKAVYKGTLSGTTVSNLTLVEGTDQLHAAGTPVEITYTAATHNDMIDGLVLEHNQDGTHGTTLVTSRTEDTTPDGSSDFVLTYDNSATALKKVKPDNLLRQNSQFSTGWISNLLPAVSSVTNNGQQSCDITFASTVASLLTPGMRLRTNRTVAAPTTCFSFDGTNDYYNDTSVSGMSFTDDFFVFWQGMVTSYTACGLVSRFNGTSGFDLTMQSTGQIRLSGHNGGAGNASYVQSIQSIPLNKRVTIVAQLDMSAFTVSSTTSYIMIDDVDVPATVARSGTNPTSLVQAGNLELGSTNAGAFLAGRIFQAAVGSAKITQANARLLSGQALTSALCSTHSIVSAYANGSTTDINTGNANNLTAQNGATTATDSFCTVNANGTPGGTYDYAIVTKVNGSTVTVQMPEGCALPTSGGISSVDLSTQAAPFGFPADQNRWRIFLLYRLSSAAYGFGALDQWTGSVFTNTNGFTVPVGDWNIGYRGTFQFGSTVSGNRSGFVIMSNATPANNTSAEMVGRIWERTADNSLEFLNVTNFTPQTYTSQQIFGMWGRIDMSTGAESWYMRGDQGNVVLWAELAYL